MGATLNSLQLTNLWPKEFSLGRASLCKQTNTFDKLGQQEKGHRHGRKI